MNEARKKPNRPKKLCPSMGGEVSFFLDEVCDLEIFIRKFRVLTKGIKIGQNGKKWCKVV